MKEAGIGRAPQLVGERSRLLRRNVEPEHLDRDQSIARRLIGPKNRTKRPNTDLVQDPKRSERWGWRRRRPDRLWSFRGGTKKCNTDA